MPWALPLPLTSSEDWIGSVATAAAAATATVAAAGDPITGAAIWKAEANTVMEEILHHLGWLKPFQWWDKPPISWCRISSIHFVSPNMPVLKSIFGTVGFETPYPTWWFLKVGASPSHHGCFNTKSWSIAWMILGYPHGKSLGLIHWVQLTWVGSVPTSVPLSRRMWWCHRHRHLCLQMHPKCLGHAVCWWEPGKVTHPNQGWFIPLISGCWWLISLE